MASTKKRILELARIDRVGDFIESIKGQEKEVLGKEDIANVSMGS